MSRQTIIKCNGPSCLRQKLEEHGRDSWIEGGIWNDLNGRGLTRVDVFLPNAPREDYDPDWWLDWCGIGCLQEYMAVTVANTRSASAASRPEEPELTSAHPRSDRSAPE